MAQCDTDFLQQILKANKTVTFPPCAPLTAKEKSVEFSLFPLSLNWAKAAAWPSIG